MSYMESVTREEIFLRSSGSGCITQGERDGACLFDLGVVPGAFLEFGLDCIQLVLQDFEYSDIALIPRF